MLTSVFAYVGIFVGIVVVLLGLYIFINIKTKKSRTLKQINGLENSKLEIVKIPVSAKLIKIKMIGQSNVVFSSIYQENQVIYDNLTSEYVGSLNESIEQARKLCLEGNYKQCSEVMKAISLRLDSFSQKMNELNTKLNGVLKDENDINAQGDLLKTRYNEALKLFDSYKQEIEFNIEKYERLIKNIDDKFYILNDYTSKGNYMDAFDLLKVLKEAIDFLYNNLRISKDLVKRVIVTIPNNLNSIIDQYNDMQKQQYPLYNILANQSLATIKEELKGLIKDLQDFNYQDIDERINELENKVTKLQNALNKEQSSREYFEANNKDIYDYASELEGKYLALFRKHISIIQNFNDNDQLERLKNTIKQDVNDLNAIRRSLDSLNYGMQPYSMRVEKLEELKAQSAKVKEDITTYNTLVYDMKGTCESSNDIVSTSATTLKKLELKVRNTNVERLIQMYEEGFQNGYAMINKLKQVINNVPIDVHKADAYSKRIEELINDLTTNCERDLLLLREAEKLLMYSSQYKTNFAEFAKAHNKAKGYFFDCRYQSAIETLVDALNRIEAKVPFEIKGVEVK